MWLTVAAMPLVGVLAQESSSQGTEWINYVLNGGPFAIVVFLIVTDRLTTPGERDRLRTELTAAHEREAKINDNLRTEVVPALTKNIDALNASAETTERLANAADKLEAFLADADRRISELTRNPPSGRT